MYTDFSTFQKKCIKCINYQPEAAPASLSLELDSIKKSLAQSQLNLMSGVAVRLSDVECISLKSPNGSMKPNHIHFLFNNGKEITLRIEDAPTLASLLGFVKEENT